MMSRVRSARKTASLVIAVACAAPLAAAAWGQDGDAIATVNGRGIPRARLVDILIEGHGLSVLQQLIVLELAKQESAKLNLTVTAQDIDAEFRRAVDSIAPKTTEAGEPLDDAARLQALEYLLAQKGLSMSEFRVGMERNAHLRKIINQQLVVDDATLREEFARLYGEKVEVRSIQLADQNGLYEATSQLKSGVEFAVVAARVSQDAATASRGGLLEPFAFNDETVAPALREAAFALTPGEHTPPIRNGRWWFILKLERRIAPQDVSFDSVRESVERNLRDRVATQRMDDLVLELFRKAQPSIRVLDRDLKPKFEELIRQNRLAPAGP